MVARDPTHLTGSLIDHVYLSNATLDKCQATATTKNIYFSDHGALRIKTDSLVFSEKSGNLFHLMSLITN